MRFNGGVIFRGISFVTLILLLAFGHTYSVSASELHALNNIKHPSIKVYKQSNITGKVTDTAGIGIPGVSVTLKSNPKRGTVTDLNGMYVLEADGNETLVFAYVNYIKQEVAINSRSVINITLREDESSLEEVVVVGFGTQKKITSIGAQSTVKVEDLKQPTANLTNSLAGRLAGVIATSRSGILGYDNAELYIRGISSFSNSSPLVLVDGVERSFHNVDPQDIESFSILKDASATAVYGVRGANGVILINTKKGKIGKPDFTFEYNEGITKLTQMPNLADGATYMRAANDAIVGRGGVARFSEDVIAKTISGEDPYLFPDVNWFDVIFKNQGRNRRANLNVNGGSESAVYYVSLGYYNEEGLFNVDELAKYNSKMAMDRFNFTSNLSLNVTKTTKLELGIQGNISTINSPGNSSNIFNSAFVMPPINIPVVYPDGKIPGIQSGDVRNPYDILTQSGYLAEDRKQIFSNVRVRQDLGFLLPGLSFTSMFSFDAIADRTVDRSKWGDNWLAIGRDAENQLIYQQTRIGTTYLGFKAGNSGRRQYYTETALNYDRTFGTDHQVSGLLLYNQRDFSDETAGNLIASVPYRSRGIAGRATYSFKEKYLAEANFGYNGSENFSPNSRFGLFPSFGLGWIASAEPFFKPLSNVINFLKFRVSYGLAGNSQIGGRRFAFLETVNTNAGGYTYGLNMNNTRTAYEIGDYAADVSWETAYKTNLGIEVRTLKDNLSLIVDLFNDRRKGIFLARDDVPTEIGLRANVLGNRGETNNRGLDATLQYNQQVGNVTLGFQGNFTFNRNIVLDDAKPQWREPYLDRKGHRIGQRFGYVSLGLFKDQDEIDNAPVHNGVVMPGDVRFKDMNGDGLINSNDQVPIGIGSLPEIVYGFGMNAAYKGFDIGLFFQGADNVDIFLSGEGFMPFAQGGTRGNLYSNITDRWTPDNPNPNAFYPRLSFGSNNDNYNASDFFLKDGRYIRLKTGQFGYTFPKKWLQGIGVKNLRVFFLGTNLLTFSPFKLWDVELGEGRGSGYPLPKAFSFGTNIRF